jgi:hypothetical protein
MTREGKTQTVCVCVCALGTSCRSRQKDFWAMSKKDHHREFFGRIDLQVNPDCLDEHMHAHISPSHTQTQAITVENNDKRKTSGIRMISLMNFRVSTENLPLI